MTGKKTVSLKCKKGLAAHIKDESSPFELNPEGKIEIDEDKYQKLHMHSVGRDKTQSDISNVLELLGYLAPDTLIKTSTPAPPKTAIFIDSKLIELRMLAGRIVIHLRSGDLVGLVNSAVEYGSICQEIRMAVSYGRPMLRGIKNTKATKDGGKVRAEIYKKNRPKYQPFINAYMEKHPKYTYSAAQEAAAKKFDVEVKTIQRYTTKPQSSEIS